MDLEKIPLVTEEPSAGWLRYEKEGEKPWFKTPVPRTVIRDASKLKIFLEKEHSLGRMLDVDVGLFSFKRRHGLRQKSVTIAPSLSKSSTPFTETGGAEKRVPEESILDRLTRNAEVLDHRKLLSNSSKMIDQFRQNDGYNTPEAFEELKKKVSSSKDLREMLANLNKELQVVDAMNLMFSDSCLAEISRIDIRKGPLVEFPASINQNLYCKIVEQGLEVCPSLILFVINMVVRRGEPVLPSDVLKVANLFSSICYVANQDLDALVKLRSLTLQVDGLSNIGLDILSDMGFAQCARSLSNHRDHFADIGPEVMNSTLAHFPYQSTLDNCDMQAEHLTVESVELETIDTSGLDTVKKTKEEAIGLFKKEQVLLGLDQHKEERDHLLYVVAVAVAKVLVEGRPEASSKLAKYLPAHHKHQNSAKKLVPAISFIVKPYPYQETKNPDTIKLLLRIQRQFLRCVAKSKGDNLSFLLLLAKLEDAEAPDDEREAAEGHVMAAVIDFGVWVGHGDLLTVKMVLEAKMLMSGSATAFGRLEYLGPFRLQMLHMKMKKTAQDYAHCMKNEINFDDILSIPWLAALTRIKVSNKGKEIKKNDSSFEKHDQFLAAVQASYLVNMFDTYHEKNGEKLNCVNNIGDVVSYVIGMLEEFDIQLYFDPTKQEAAARKEGEDDLFHYCKVSASFAFKTQTHVCNATFKHLPKHLISHRQSFRTLGQLLKIPPLFAQILHSAGERGVPEYLAGGILIYSARTKIFYWFVKCFRACRSF